MIDTANAQKSIMIIEVESRPNGRGDKQKLFACMNDDELSTAICGQEDIQGVNYAYSTFWRTDYKGKFDLLGVLYIDGVVV